MSFKKIVNGAMISKPKFKSAVLLDRQLVDTVTMLPIPEGESELAALRVNDRVCDWRIDDADLFDLVRVLLETNACIQPGLPDPGCKVKDVKLRSLE